MAHNIYLISGGVNYHLSNAAVTPYTGIGAPWTVQGTTPYEIAMNDVTGPRWTPQAAPALLVWSGGPPFRNGRTLIDKSYDNGTETIPIQMRGGGASPHDNAVFLKQQLSRILNTALFGMPCILAVQPDGSTNTAYFEIYSADVQEDPRFINDETGQGMIRALVTWVRSPRAGVLSTGETALNAVSFQNTGTGGTDNVAPYAAGSGDFIYEGQPLNIKLQTASVAAQTVTRLFLASVYSRVYSAASAGAFTTASVVGTRTALDNFDISAVITRAALKPRVLLRLSTTANCAIWLTAGFSGSGTLYTSREQTFSAGTTILDFGTFSLAGIRRTLGLSTAVIDSMYLNYRSTNGSNATVTLASLEYLLCYDFARIDPSPAPSTAGGSAYFQIDQFAEQSGGVCLPHPTARVFLFSGSNFLGEAPASGQLPRYWSGASLYAAWLETNQLHTTTRTASVTATQAPLWRTFRGAD